MAQRAKKPARPKRKSASAKPQPEGEAEVALEPVARRGQLRWRWSVQGERGGETGEARSAEEAKHAALQAKKRL